MQKITEVTRKEIITLFKEGYLDDDSYISDSKYFTPESQRCCYAYYGGLSELEFLKRIYRLDQMPSSDPRFANAEEDIRQHTIYNEDFNYGWVFSDDRFGLNKGEDDLLLRFLCEVFHPACRKENDCWEKYLLKINELLHPDGYELYSSMIVSGRKAYHWRDLTDVEIRTNEFMPFSLRYEGFDIIMPKIKLVRRKQLKELMLREKTNSKSFKQICKSVIKDIKKFYVPRAFNERDEYIQEEDFEKLLMHTSPKTVFDIIELYAKKSLGTFQNEVNIILEEIGYKLLDGKIMFQKEKVKSEIPREPDLKELLKISERYYLKEDVESKQLALEKLWDAFEKLKTYYSEDKKKSMEQVLDKISKGDDVLYEVLEKEFKYLTRVGNDYQIRHFETGKRKIKDVRVKEYWYTRCLAIINLAIEFIEN